MFLQFWAASSKEVVAFWLVVAFFLVSEGNFYFIFLFLSVFYNGGLHVTGRLYKGLKAGGLGVATHVVGLMKSKTWGKFQSDGSTTKRIKRNLHCHQSLLVSTRMVTWSPLCCIIRQQVSFQDLHLGLNSHIPTSVSRLTGASMCLTGFFLTLECLTNRSQWA